nr:uncharacterized protein LOC105489309 isoform X2 [Macaca nemestrina]
MSKMYAIRTMAPDLGKLNSTANSQHSEQSARQSETSTFAIFLRFVRIGMTQSTEGKLLGKSNNQKDAWGTGSQNRSMEFDDSNVQPHGSASGEGNVRDEEPEVVLGSRDSELGHGMGIFTGGEKIVTTWGPLQHRND